MTLLCGRFEGVDERVLEARGIEEISLGDFVLSGGEPAAIALIDACVRLLPGVVGRAGDTGGREFRRGLLEYPHYTRPADWQGRPVPEVLVSGDHERIKAWRRAEAEAADPGAAARSVGRAMCAERQQTKKDDDDDPDDHLNSSSWSRSKKLEGGKTVPDFAPGDTVRVDVKVVEGERERIQAFEGVCIARKNAGINSNFTVRKISYGEGVERVFPLYSPRIAAIEVVRRGDVRRAKLYYLRGRRGKSARIAEKTRRRCRQRSDPEALAETSSAS